MGNCLCKPKQNRRKSIHTPETQSECDNAITELLETERRYGEDLNYMVTNYLDPLRSELLFNDQTGLIAYNSVTLDLLQIQAKFQDKLEKAVVGHDTDTAEVVCNVADAFIDSEKDFKIYNKYILCMSRVQKIVSKSQGIDKVLTFLDQKYDQLKKASGDGQSPRKIMTMASLIMKPFQRIMLYPLILERIEEQCEKRTMDRDKIKKAIKVVKSVGNQMNETLKKDEKSNSDFDKLLKEYDILEYAKKMSSSK